MSSRTPVMSGRGRSGTGTAATSSIAVGAAAGLIVGFAGPVLGGLAVVLGVVLIARFGYQFDPRWLFVGFTPVWIGLVIVGTNATTDLLADVPVIRVAVGFVPLALAVAVARALAVETQRDGIDRRDPSV